MTTKIGLIADPHFANHAAFGYPIDNRGVNQRLRVISQAVAWQLDRLVSTEGVSCVFFMGDLTEHHGVLDPAVLWAIRNTFSTWAYDVPIHIFPGNHDLDRYGNSITPALTLSGVVRDTVVRVPDLENVYVIPYFRDKDSSVSFYRDLQSGCPGDGGGVPQVILTHADFIGASFRGSDDELNLCTDGLGGKDVEGPWTIFTGHYHRAQELQFNDTPVVYCGGVVQHSFGEAGYTPQSVVVEIDGKRVSWYGVETPTSLAPRFFNVGISSSSEIASRYDLPGNPDMDYYKFIAESSEESLNLAAVLTKQVQHAVIKVLPAVNALERSRVEKVLESQKAATPDDVVEAYVRLHAPKSEHKVLLDYGKGILDEVYKNE